VIIKTLKDSPQGDTSIDAGGAAGDGNEPVGDHVDLAGVWAQAASDRELKLSPNPQFIDNVRDLVGLSLIPPEAAALCAWMRRPGPGAGSLSTKGFWLHHTR